ncbi:MAG: ATP-dependent Clp protease adaptor ClpS [bacterium]|nr:ATP-dependent Clp protease adaptor ClpS [bacterium]
MANQDEAAVESPPTPEADQGNATAVATRPKPAPPKPKMLPPYKVLLHNDDVNDVEHVIRCIIKLTHLTLEEAIERTLQAHTGKVALLLVTHRERAELYCEQFATFQLTVTAEPDA